jgi:hypothetical protein
MIANANYYQADGISLIGSAYHDARWQAQYAFLQPTGPLSSSSASVFTGFDADYNTTEILSGNYQIIYKSCNNYTTTTTQTPFSETIYGTANGTGPNWFANNDVLSCNRNSRAALYCVQQP